MNTNKTLESAMHSKLSAVEAQLESPVMSGELAEWLRESEEVVGGLLPALHAHIEHRHQELIAEIIEQNPGLMTRAEQLKSEDHKLLEEAERFERMLSSTAEHRSSWEPDENRASHAVEKIVEDGLALVIRVRKQESAIGAWLMEAFERDQGVAD